VNRRDRQYAAAPSIGDCAVSRLQLSIDLRTVPSLSMPDVRDAEIVLLGPEERDSVKRFAVAKDVACRRLSLALGHDKMFDADSFAREPVRPACDVAGCEDARNTGLEVFVHCDAAINGEPRSFRQ